MRDSSRTGTVVRRLIPAILILSIVIFIWTFAFDAAGTDFVDGGDQVASRPADADPVGSGRDGVDQADPSVGNTMFMNAYPYPVTVKQAFDISPVVAEVEVGIHGQARWSTTDGEPRGGLDHIYTPVSARVLQVFKGENLPSEITLKKFGGTVEGSSSTLIADGFAKVGSLGERQIVFIYPWTVPGTNEVVWVTNQSWSVTGNVVLTENGVTENAVGSVAIDRIELESLITAASQTPYEGLTFKGRDSSGPVYDPGPLPTPSSIP